MGLTIKGAHVEMHAEAGITGGLQAAGAAQPQWEACGIDLKKWRTWRTCDNKNEPSVWVIYRRHCPRRDLVIADACVSGV